MTMRLDTATLPIPTELKTALGGDQAIARLPQVNLGQGPYSDYFSPSENQMTSSIMVGKEPACGNCSLPSCGRSFVVLKIQDLNGKNVIMSLFQRYSDNPNAWMIGSKADDFTFFFQHKVVSDRMPEARTYQAIQQIIQGNHPTLKLA